jgi:hypothetical protein
MACFTILATFFFKADKQSEEIVLETSIEPYSKANSKIGKS